MNLERINLALLFVGLLSVLAVSQVEDKCPIDPPADCETDCTPDRECTDGKICCPYDQCGDGPGTVCMDPVDEILDDVCSSYDEGIAGCVSNCTDDNDCPDQGTCCNYGDDCKLCRYGYTCTVHGVEYLPGQTYTSTDGCNTCTCQHNGVPTCTKDVCYDSCEYNNNVFRSGRTFHHIDGCNTCQCENGDITCTEESCSCEYGDEIVEFGKKFPARDGCNTCECTKRGVLCTEMYCDEPCDMNLLRECFVEMSEMTFYIMASSQKDWMCRARDHVKHCVESNLRVCRENFGPIMLDTIAPYPGMLSLISDSGCESDHKIEIVDHTAIKRAGQCMVDFSKVMVHGSVVATCRQARLSLKCIQEATYNCSENYRNMFTMVTTVLDKTIQTLCAPDSCNLAMAEQCIAESYYTLTAPLYREGGSLLTCSSMKATLSCAFSHTIGCKEQYEEKRKENPYAHSSCSLRIRYYLDFIDDMKQRWDAMKLAKEKEDRMGDDMVDKDKDGMEKGKESASESEEDMDTSFEDSREMLNRHFDTIKKRVGYLIHELKDESESEEEEMDELKGKIKEFENYIEEMKWEFDRELSGKDVEHKMSKLYMMKEHFDEFLNKNRREAMENNEVRAIEEYLDKEVHSHMMVLQDKLHELGMSFAFLHDRVNNFCVHEPMYEMYEKGKEALVVIGRLLGNPYVNGKKLCRLVEKVEKSAGMLHDMELPMEYVQDFKASVKYMRHRVRGLCWSDDIDDVEEPCVKLVEGEVAECDTVKAISCFNPAELSAEFLMAFTDADIISACQSAQKTIDCVLDYTATCDGLMEDVRGVLDTIQSLSRENCDLDMTRLPVCKQPETCSPITAISECFPDINTDATDICVYTEQEVFPCLHVKLAPCTSWIEVIPVQLKINDYLAKYENPDSPCLIERTLVYDDLTSASAECDIKYMEAIREGVKSRPNFNDALCLGFAAHYECSLYKPVSSLQAYLDSQHERFYNEFWDMNCKWMDEEDEEDVVALDWEGCDIDGFMMILHDILYSYPSMLGAFSSTKTYAEICSDKNMDGLIQQLNDLSCPLSARNVISSVIPFLHSYRDEYCPVAVKISEMTCSMEGVKQCIDSAANYLALYSPYMNGCMRLDEVYQCVHDYSYDCDNDTLDKVKFEWSYFLGVLGNVDCEQPSWCPRMPNFVDEETMADKTEDKMPEMIPTPEVSMICSNRKTCSMSINQCFLDTPELTCNSSEAVRDCIAELVYDCPDLLKVFARLHIDSYLEEQMIGPECNIMPDMLVDVVDTSFTRCLNNFMETEINSTSGFMTGLNNFYECIRSDIDDAFDVTKSVAYRGILRSYLKIVENFLDDHAYAYVLPNPDDFEDERGNCTLNDMVPMLMKKFVAMSLVMPFYPPSDRLYMCSSGKEILEYANMLLEECHGGSKQQLSSIIMLSYTLTNSMGYCSTNPSPRECRPEAAVACVTEMGHDILEAAKTGFQYSLCSKSMQHGMCVGYHTVGCNGKVKGMVEETFWALSSFAEGMCTPPTQPEPTLQCHMLDKGKVCDVDGAVRCMFDLYKDMSCKKPDWNKICGSVPYARTCVDRHLSSCPQDKKDSVMETAKSIMSKVKDHCPEVDCDICGAQTCLARWEHMRGKDKDFCRLASSMEECVEKNIGKCRPQHTKEIMARFNLLKEQSAAICLGKFESCFNDFKQTAWKLLIYNGETLAPYDDDDDNSESSRSNSEDSDSESSKSKESGSKGSQSEGSGGKGTKSEGSGGKGTKSEGSGGKGTKSEGSGGKGTKSEGSGGKGTKSEGSGGKGTKSEGSGGKGTKSEGSGGKGTKSEGSGSKGTKSEGSGGKGTKSEGSGGKGTKSEGSGGKGTKSEGSGGKGTKSEGSRGKGNRGSKGKGSRSKGSEGKSSGSQDKYCDVFVYEDEEWDFGDLSKMVHILKDSDGFIEIDKMYYSYDGDSYGEDSGMGSMTSDSDMGSMTSDSDMGSRSMTSDSEDESSQSLEGSEDYDGSDEDDEEEDSDEEDDEENDSDDDDDTSPPIRTKRSKKSGSKETGSKKSGSKKSGSKASGSKKTGSKKTGSKKCSGKSGSKSCGEKSGSGTKSCKKGSKSCHKNSGSVGPSGSGSSDSSMSSEPETRGSGSKSNNGKIGVCVVKRPVSLHPDLSKLCQHLYETYTCVKSRLDILEQDNVREVVGLVMHGVLQLASQKCSVIPQQCHSCQKAKSHKECDAEPVEFCYGKKQICQTVEVTGEKGYVSKGCVDEEYCYQEQYGHGQRSVCCKGNLCNAGIPTYDNSTLIIEDLPRPRCQPYSQTFCALNLVSQLVKYGWMKCGLFVESINCMSTMDDTCKHDNMGTILDLYTSYIHRTTHWTRCLNRQRHCKCGGLANMVLDGFWNPYANTEMMCRHLDAAIHITENAAWEQCSVDDYDYAFTNLKIYSNSLGKMCQKPEGKFITDLCPPDKPEVRCYRNPCEGQVCRSVPEAVCSANYCGGCNALFYVDGEEMTDQCDSSDEEDVCMLPMETGPCRAYIESWAYNYETGMCEELIYGGCRGNKNRFSTQEECAQSCIYHKPCADGYPVVRCAASPCKDKTCSKFKDAVCIENYCNGCNAFFYNEGKDVTNMCEDPVVDRCMLPAEPGFCKAYFPSWTYNYETGTCEQFIYGGCGGNANRFDSKYECMSGCINETDLLDMCDQAYMELLNYASLSALSADIACRVYQLDFKVWIKETVAKCPLPEEREAMIIQFNADVFNWTICEVEGFYFDEFEALPTCCSMAEVRANCSVDDVAESEYDCQDLSATFQCVRDMTQGCNGIQYLPLYTDIQMLLINGQCDLSLMELDMDDLSMVSMCTYSYLLAVSNGLISGFIPAGETMDICKAKRAFQRCVNHIPNLPTKSRVAAMMDIADDIHMDFCPDYEEDVEEFTTLQCYACDGAENDEDCNKNTEVCDYGKGVCYSSTTCEKNKCMIHKGCESIYAVKNLQGTIQFERTLTNSYYCRGSLCNGQNTKLPDDDTDDNDEDGDEGTGDMDLPAESPDLNEADTCKYKEIGTLARQHLVKMFTLPFFHTDDYWNFCSDLENVGAMVMEYNTGCSELTSERIMKVYNRFESLSVYACPQTVDEPEEECDWRPCINPIMPLYRTVTMDDKCINVGRTMSCLKDRIHHCGNEEREEIALTLGHLRKNSPSMDCIKDLDDLICEVSQLDPEDICDVGEAENCEFRYQRPFFGDEETNCIADVDRTKCVRHFTGGCKDGSADELMDGLPDLSECDAFTDKATFDPFACETNMNGFCNISSVISYVKHFLDDTSNVCQITSLPVRDQFFAELTQCSSLAAAVVENSFISGGKILDENCVLSVGVDEEYHSSRDCIDTFFAQFDLDDVCGSLDSLRVCLYNETMKSSDYYQEMMFDSIDVLSNFVDKKCVNVEIPDPVVPDCNPRMEAHCISMYGMLSFVGPFLPAGEKHHLCSEWSTLIESCTLYTYACDAEQVQPLRDFFDDVYERYSQTVCVDMEIEWPEEPVKPPQCDPEMAVHLISELGLALSGCVSNCKEKVCGTIDFVREQVNVYTQMCPFDIVRQVNASWDNLYTVMEVHCFPNWGKSLIQTPHCIDPGYISPADQRSCRPNKAQECMNELETEAMKVRLTEVRICAMLRYAIMCVSDYTSSCNDDVTNVLYPKFDKIVANFEKRCPNIWCPAKEYFGVCYVESAEHCIETFSATVKMNPEKACSMVSLTRECISKVTVDCGGRDGIFVKQLFERVDKMALTVCRKPKDPAVDAMVCINKYERLALQLIDLDLPEEWSGYERSEEKSNSASHDEDENTTGGKSDGDASSGKGNTGEESHGNGNNDEGDDTVSEDDEGNDEGEDTVSDDDGSNDEGEDTENGGASDEDDGTDDGEEGRKKRSAKASKQKSTSNSAGPKTKGTGSGSKETNGDHTGPRSKETSRESRSRTVGGSGDRSSRGNSGRQDWNNDIERVYENSVNGLCMKLEAAWKCVETSLDMLNPKQKVIAYDVMLSLRDAVVERCRPISCYSCVDLDDNGDCNTQKACPCPSSQQMCYSRYENGKYHKGCTSKKGCKECMGQKDCYCCDGHKCNKPGIIKEPKVCNVHTAIECAFSLVYVTIRTHEVTASIMREQLHCVITHTEGCMSTMYSGLYTVCGGIITMFERGKCISAYGEPSCGTPGVLALGNLMTTPYKSKTSVCRQYKTTRKLADELYFDSYCSDDEIYHLEDSISLATQLIGGYCDLEGPEVCNVQEAERKCILDKVWLIDGERECSDAMYVAFKDCLLSYVRDCNAQMRGVLHFGVTTHLKRAFDDCQDEITTDIPELLGQIFPLGPLSKVTDGYIYFIESISRALTVGSLNFAADLCRNVDELKSFIQSQEFNPLLHMFVDDDAKTIVRQLEDICDDTSFSDDDVSEVCESSSVDIVLILDGSGSVGEENFELIREFAIDIVKQADLRIVRIAVVLFSDEAYPLFDMKEHLSDDGVQDRNEMIKVLEATPYPMGKTNTASAIDMATEFFSDQHGAREDAADTIILLVDGVATVNKDNLPKAVKKAKDYGIHIMAVGMGESMVGEEAEEELALIASEPTDVNILQADFIDLEKFYRGIFRYICIRNTVSQCDFVDIVYTSSSSLLYSMSLSYQTFDQTSIICSTLSSMNTVVTTLTSSCATYQQRSLHMLDVMIKGQYQKFCLSYEVEDVECDMSDAMMCVTDAAQFLRSSRTLTHDAVCMRIGSIIDCLDYYMPECGDKAVIADGIQKLVPMLRNRCEPEVMALQCWSSSTVIPVDTMSASGSSASCDFMDVVDKCLVDDGILSATLSCEIISNEIKDLVSCVKENCVILDEELAGNITDEILDTFAVPLQLFECDYPDVDFELPEVIEEPECELIGVCDLAGVTQCLDFIDPEDGCRNIDNVTECMLANLMDCSDDDYNFAVIQALEFLESRNLNCLDGFNGLFDAKEHQCFKILKSAIGDPINSNCDTLTLFVECVRNAETSFFSQALTMPVLDRFTDFLDNYCLEGQVFDDTCDAMPPCMVEYLRAAVRAPFLQQAGKTQFCEKYEFGLQCESEIKDCQNSQELYNLIKVFVHISGTCRDDAYICSTMTSMNCITMLSEAVTVHDYMSTDSSHVCWSLDFTRECLRHTLAGCNKHSKLSIMNTFHNIECLALDVCTTGEVEAPEIEGEPLKCVDPMDVTEYADCDIHAALYCIDEFESVAMTDFSSNGRATCLAYSDMLSCVYENIFTCNATATRAVRTYVDTISNYIEDLSCPTIVKSPCVEDPDCGARRARRCIDSFYASYETYLEEGTVCLHVDAVRTCIETNIATCSDNLRMELMGMISIMVEDYNVSCTENFYECSLKYVRYAKKIIEWKEVIDEESEESSESEDTNSESESQTGSNSETESSKKTKKSEKSQKTNKSEKSKKTKKSEKSKKTNKSGKSKKTNESEEEKSESGTKSKSNTATKESGSKSKEKSKESKSKSKGKTGSGSKSKEKSEKSQKGSKAPTSTGSSQNSVKSPSIDRTVELQEMCAQFQLAWECVGATWSELEDSVYDIIHITFLQYHTIVFDICNGPRPGYCSVVEGKSEKLYHCDTDYDCSGKKKCCRRAEQNTCVDPTPDNKVCYQKLVSTSYMALDIVSSLYRADQYSFCSIYEEHQLTISTVLSSTNCPDEYFFGLNVVLEEILTYSRYCSVTTPTPTLCVEAEYKACFDAYTPLATGDEKCSGFETLKACIGIFMSNCNAENELEAGIISSVELQIDAIKSVLSCEEMPSIQCSIDQPTIILQEGAYPGEILSVSVDSELSCEENKNCYIRIYYQLTEDEAMMPQCSDGNPIKQIVASNCGMEFRADNILEPQDVSLSARVDMKIEQDDYKAKFSVYAVMVIDEEEKVTKEICNYQVIVIDNDRNSICSTINDPHILTFDRKFYDNFMSGEFLLYRNPITGYAVYVYFTTCKENDVVASCTCGMCAGLEDDMACINRCYGRAEHDLIQPTIWKNKDINSGLRIIQTRNGKAYTLIFPSGTTVRVFLERPQAGANLDYINVMIQPSASDYKNTEGLCGFYDGNEDNDWIGADGKLYTDLNEFNKQWWTEDPNDFVMTGVSEQPEDPSPVEHCMYTADTCECGSQSIVETCDMITEGVDITDTVRIGNEKRRKKRATGDAMNGMIMVNGAIAPLRTFPTKSGITEDQANETCYNALSGADFIQQCSNVIDPGDVANKTLNCVEDIKQMNSLTTDYIRTAKETLREKCIIQASTSSNTTLINDLKNVTCPDSCNGQGTCENGTCVCNNGYLGFDCGIDIATPPDLDYLEDPLCVSIIDAACVRVNVVGNNFVNGSFCHIEKIEMLASGEFNRTGVVQTIPSTWRTFEELSCDLSQIGGLPLHLAMISVSNNGLLPSQSVKHLYIAHNPICYTCTPTSLSEGTCLKERASCVENGVCYRPLEEMVDDPCYVCDVYTEQRIYQPSDSCPPLTTAATTTEESEGDSESRMMNDSLVIGISAGAAGLVLIIFVVVVLVLTLRYMKAKRNETDKKDLTRRSNSSASGEDGFREVLYPAYPNYGYQEGYPAMYLEAPQDYFVESIPKRHSNRRSDPTRDSHDQGDHRRSRHHHNDDAVFENRHSTHT